MSDGPVSIGEIQERARLRFEAAGLDDPATDARVLISGLLGKSAAELLLYRNDHIDGDLVEQIGLAIERRAAHEPVHRILGRRAFYDIELALSAETLEPRPDTEVLIDMLLPHLRKMAAAKPVPRILDLGTGTGAIGLSLVHAVESVEAVLTDLSPDALATATRNAESLGLASRVKPVLSSWYDKVEGRFDIIVSNPPYIVTSLIDSLSADVKCFDPILALDGGPDGLDAYRRIAEGALVHLAEGGLVAVEIGYDQKEQVTALFEAAGLHRVEAVRDLGGNDRALLFAA